MNDDGRREVDDLVRHMLAVSERLKEALDYAKDILQAEVSKAESLKPGSLADAAWSTFVEAHPELQPSPIEYEDSLLLAAVRDVIRANKRTARERGWKHKCDEVATTREVAEAAHEALAERPPNAGDRVRVRQGLTRLAAAGRLERFKRRDYNELLWAPGGFVPSPDLQVQLVGRVSPFPFDDTEVLRVLRRARRLLTIPELLTRMVGETPAYGARQTLSYKLVQMRERELVSSSVAEGRRFWKASARRQGAN